MHQLFIVTLVASCNTNNFFFGAEIYNLQKKKSAKIKCLLSIPKPQKFHTAEITGYTVLMIEMVGLKENKIMQI